MTNKNRLQLLLTLCALAALAGCADLDPPTFGYGQECLSGGDCHSGVCVNMGSFSLCSSACPAGACPSGDTCRTLAGGQKYCVPFSGKGEVKEDGGVTPVADTMPLAPDKCVPNCGVRQCGSDGCGGTCGSCGSSRECCSGSGGSTTCKSKPSSCTCNCRCYGCTATVTCYSGCSSCTVQCMKACSNSSMCGGYISGSGNCPARACS